MDNICVSCKRNSRKRDCTVLMCKICCDAILCIPHNRDNSSLYKLTSHIEKNDFKYNYFNFYYGIVSLDVLILFIITKNNNMKLL